MALHAQYALDIAPVPSLHAEDYVISAANHALCSVLLQLPSELSPIVVLSGAKASGKTHLLRWLASKRDVVWLQPAELGYAPSEQWMKPGLLYVLDDAQLASEAALAQAINVARAGGSMLLLSVAEDASWQTQDLRSRMMAAHRLFMPEADDALRSAVLIKRLSDLQWRCEPEVISFILSRLPRDMGSLQQFIARAHLEGLVQKRALTVPFAARILAELESSHVS